MKNNIINLFDVRKKKNETHTIDSAPVFLDLKACELTDEQLENVIGGMSEDHFSHWRSTILNNYLSAIKNDN